MNEPSMQARFNRLNQWCKFDYFIVGDSNLTGFQAAQAVAAGCKGCGNPLVITGGIGMGKTHLLQAIANKIRAEQPATKTIYFSAWEFMDEMIESVRQKRSTQFRAIFQGADILLIDGLQLVQGKEVTTEELLQIFQNRIDRGKQIVIACSPFEEMAEADGSLLSLLKGGLVVEIGTPGSDCRRRIIRLKADMSGMKLPEDVVEMLAEKSACIRELEGAVIRLHAAASIQGSPVTLEFAKKILPR